MQKNALRAANINMKKQLEFELRKLNDIQDNISIYKECLEHMDDIKKINKK